MKEKKYTADHEWLELEGDIVTVGITEYAQQQLGDVVYIELPEQDQSLSVGESAVVIESVKAAGEICVPLAGTVVAVNTALVEEPERVNEDPTGDGWFFRMRMEQGGVLDGLLGEDDYSALID